MKEKNMSQKYDGKIWVKNVKIIFFLNATKKMWDKNVGLKKCETKNVSIKNVIVKKCFSKKMTK